MLNLDAMDVTELAEWGKTHQNPTIEQCQTLFPKRKNVIPIVRNLSQYAINKATSMTHRLKGEIPEALMFEQYADNIYNRLPEFARW